MMASYSIFYDLIKSTNKPLLADFYNTYTGPITMLNEDIRNVVQEFESDLHLVKVDIKKNKRASGLFNTPYSPALLFIEKGMLQWAMTPEQIDALELRNRLMNSIHKTITL